MKSKLPFILLLFILNFSESHAGLKSTQNHIDSPKTHFISFFQRFEEEKRKSTAPMAVVHIKDKMLKSVLWKSSGLRGKQLILGHPLKSFFNEKGEFPMKYTKNIIAIIYENENGAFFRKDDGAQADSFIYDDRLVLGLDNLYHPIYNIEIMPGVTSGLTKEQIIKGLNQKLLTIPLQMSCSSDRRSSFETVPFKSIEERLVASYFSVTTGEAIEMSYDKITDQFRLNYTLKGLDGVTSGEELFPFYKFKINQVLIPHDLIFTEDYHVSDFFRESFIDNYYPFLAPTVCSVERTILEVIL